jgi:hypothetical protein
MLRLRVKGFKVQGLGFRVNIFVSRGWCLGFRNWGFEFTIKVLGLKRFRIQGYRVQGFGVYG